MGSGACGHGSQSRPESPWREDSGLTKQARVNVLYTFRSGFQPGKQEVGHQGTKRHRGGAP